MTSPAVFWRTVRHLKPRQFTARVAFRLARPQPQIGPAPPRRIWPGPWKSPAGRAPSLLAAQRFRFLNVEGELSALGWSGPAVEKLWRYNQHYFDDLNALQAPRRRDWHRALIEKWIVDNPPAQGDGWEPYPTSLRIVNWIKASASGFELPAMAGHSLAVQTRWLLQRLEWHLLGNHLFANAKALVLAGLAFEGNEANTWLEQGLAILRKQLPEQVLQDGGQFERSPMYHALALEDVLDLINAAQASRHAAALPLLEQWRRTAERMLHWLLVMTHPDGRLACFNDSAHGIAPDNDELIRYASSLGLVPTGIPPGGAIHLADSGYVRLSCGPAVAFLDVAPVGPDYLPGHAHADTLSFELSLLGRRLVVNGGTSCYGNSARRLHERGTAAHSTVQVDGLDSSEVWSGFRVGRRARPLQVQVEDVHVGAAHDGYAWLSGRPLHHRDWWFTEDTLEVDDRVTVKTLPAEARYHLAPGLEMKPLDEGVWQVMDGMRVLATVSVSCGAGRVELSSHAPAFGVVTATCCLVVTCKSGQARTRWTWAQ